MTSAGFSDAMKVVLAYEGGAVDHPKDPGGRTNQGITQRVYDGYLDRLKKPRRDVFAINTIEVHEIYRLQYWRRVSADALPEGVDVVVFDGAVNSGPVQSIKWLQRALGNVKVDGNIGEVTLAAVADHPDHDQLIASIIAIRLGFMKALRTWKTFRGGWTRRVEHLKAVGQSLATGSVGPAPEYFAGGEAKAMIADARPALSSTLAAGVSGGGGVAALLSTAQAKLEPFVGTFGWIDKVVACLAVAGVAVLIGGGAYSWWVQQYNAALSTALDLRPAEAAA